MAGSLKTLPKGDRTSWRIPVCDECEKRAPLQINLLDTIWSQIAKHRREILCLKCIEDRLKRPITLEDLKPCGLKRMMLLGVAIWSRQQGGKDFQEMLEE